MFNDKLLLWKMKCGSSEALCRIYEKYKIDLLSLAIALLGDINTAEDVVHDVFVSFVESVGTFRLTGSLKGYLLTCVANLSRDRIRKMKKKLVVSNQTDFEMTDLSMPDQTAISIEELKQLRDAIIQLPYEQREIIILHLHGGRTFRQIAALKDSSIGTIQSRYRYGLKKLRQLLNGEVEQ